MSVPPKTSALLALICETASLSIYGGYWLYRRRAAFNGLASEAKVGLVPIVALLAFTCTDAVAGDDVNVFVRLFVHAGALLAVQFGHFRVRRILMDHSRSIGRPRQINRLMVLVWGFGYLQAHINEIFHDPGRGPVQLAA